jgi:hypothetical protein
MARMRILTTNEQQAFDKPPLFDHRDRKKYFDLPKGLMDIAKSVRTPLGVDSGSVQNDTPRWALLS